MGGRASARLRAAVPPDRRRGGQREGPRLLPLLRPRLRDRRARGRGVPPPPPAAALAGVRLQRPRDGLRPGRVPASEGGPPQPARDADARGPGSHAVRGQVVPRARRGCLLGGPLRAAVVRGPRDAPHALRRLPGHHPGPRGGGVGPRGALALGGGGGRSARPGPARPGPARPVLLYRPRRITNARAQTLRAGLPPLRQTVAGRPPAPVKTPLITISQIRRWCRG